jgi:hypothetical protein
MRRVSIHDLRHTSPWRGRCATLRQFGTIGDMANAAQNGCHLQSDLDSMRHIRTPVGWQRTSKPPPFCRSSSIASNLAVPLRMPKPDDFVTDERADAEPSDRPESPLGLPRCAPFLTSSTTAWLVPSTFHDRLEGAPTTPT